MKFGKQIQAHQVPGWSPHYLDYKCLKKIISSLAAHRPAAEAAALAQGLRPSDLLSTLTPIESASGTALRDATAEEEEDGRGEPPIFPPSEQDNRGPDFQAHKAAFFFKLERELEKINAFYLLKEAEMKLRLETLLSKRRAAAARVLPDSEHGSPQDHVEWIAVEEGFRLLERDLGKLEQFIDINAIGFRKILKKWDKRSKSAMKEMYLARQVDVQPVFNRQLVSEMSNTVAACLLNVTDLSTGLAFEGPEVHNTLMTHHLLQPEATYAGGAFRDLETNFKRAVETSDRPAVVELVHYADALAQDVGARANTTRILWRVVIRAPADMADLILASVSTPFNFLFVDDINGRTCLHEAAMAGELRLVEMCLEKGVQGNKPDAYGRTGLHYAVMKGHANVSRRLLRANCTPDLLDMDNYSPLIYATLRGCVDCVQVLLEHDLVVCQLTAPADDLIPLSLASKAGHAAVVSLLLQHGARCVPNSSGEYPMHLAAMEGHTDVCRLLLHHEGWDLSDRYHEWTPLFHAARHGHEGCLDVLLAAGARVDLLDEHGCSAAHYAAWYGHYPCMNRLLERNVHLYPSLEGQNISQRISPASAATTSELDVDLIPSLSLPPPIMPHRVYGHNYLDRSCLVQVTMGSPPSSASAPSQVYNRFLRTTAEDSLPLSSPPLKLVVTSPNANVAPYSIPISHNIKSTVFSFQVTSLENLSLEFSVFPRIGTKTIGRNILVPTVFKGIKQRQSFVLPILDNRLQQIGEIYFKVAIIKPFSGVTLEVGGSIETYWKSMSNHGSTPAPQPHRSLPVPGSNQTSPSNRSVTGFTGHGLTISSLSGNYVHLTVQVTRDHHPVVFPDWLLPETGFDLGVSDVSFMQFKSLANRLGRFIDSETCHTPEDWQRACHTSMISLADLMQLLPIHIGLTLELAYPPEIIRDTYGLSLNLNDFVDSVLRTIYQLPMSAGGVTSRRRLNFISLSPDICSALNWKQPNYPVFFLSQCRHPFAVTTSPVAISYDDDTDERLASLSAAVQFSKANNFLGIFVDAELLNRVPSLIQAIKDAGLLVGTYGGHGDISPNFISGGDDGPDALMRNGIVVYKDHDSQ